MKKLSLLIVIFFALVSIGYCQEPVLQLIIKSDKEQYEVGEEIKLTGEIKNLSDKKECINTFRNDSNFKANLKNTNGESFSFEFPLPALAAMAGERDIKCINPQETYNLGNDIPDIHYVLSKDENPIKTGVIDVSFEYILRQPSSWWSEDKQPPHACWQGTLVSNTITIEIVGKESAELSKEYEKLNSFIMPTKGTPRKSIEEVYGEPDPRPTPQYGNYSLNNGTYQLDVQYDNNLVAWASIPMQASPATSDEMKIRQLKESIKALSDIRTNYLEKLKNASWNKDKIVTGE